MEQKALKLIMAGLLILSMALTGREAAEYVGAMHAVNALRETGMGADDSGRLCVVVDAGHGGDDPGKIGINGAPEKDINLQIAQKLKKYLDDLCLPYPEGAKNSCLVGKWFDKTLSFEENDRKIQSIEINRKTENELLINFHLKDRLVSVEAGFENWITQEAVFDDPHHFLNSFSYAFKDDKTLVIKQYWLNMSGYDIYTLHFQDDSVNGMIITSVKLGGAVPIELSGNIQ